MNDKAQKELREHLIYFAEREGLDARRNTGVLFLAGKEINHGYDEAAGKFFAKCDYLFCVDGADAKHVAAVFMAHMIFREGDGVNISL